jgi:hypothetical protein
MNPLAQPHRLVAAGALGIALTTAAEVLTAPYSGHVVLYELNPTVHAVKVAAALVFVAGLLALAARYRATLCRVGVGAAVALAAGTTMGAIPYSVAETTLDPNLGPAEAAAWLDTAYEAQLAWIGHLASVGMLLVLVGLITLAVVVMRRGLLPRWRPLLSLAALPLGVLAGVLGGTTGLPVPHPPAWVFLCLGIAYAAPLATTARAADTLGSSRARHGRATASSATTTQQSAGAA